MQAVGILGANSQLARRHAGSKDQYPKKSGVIRHVVKQMRKTTNASTGRPWDVAEFKILPNRVLNGAAESS